MTLARALLTCIVVLASALSAIGCATAKVRPRPPAQRADRGERILVLSRPRGALILLGDDTLAPAPVAFRYDRTGIAGVPREIFLQAVPLDAGQCLQRKTIAYDEPTPDTVRFDMQRCLPRAQDVSRVFEDSEVTIRPERVSSPPVSYPHRLRQAGIQGSVILRVVIDTTGRADSTSLEVLHTTHDDFTPVARDVCLHSTYTPGRLYDQKVRVRVRMPINFTIARLY